MLNRHYHITSTLTKFGINHPSLEALSPTKNLVNDTRTLVENDIFFAVIGTTQDGREYIESAIEKGASLIISECQHVQLHGQVLEKTVADRTAIVVQFYQLNEKLIEFSAHYYQSPQLTMDVIGVTGTNGKTSTTQLIGQLIDAVSSKTPACGIIGTNGAGSLDALAPIMNTTPGATELMGLFAQFRSQQLTHVVMEVSSHALEQKRVSADLFDVAVFTNLSRDHLDYHQTMEAYGEAKLSIFKEFSSQVAVVNGDEKVIQDWLAKSPDQDIIVFGQAESVKSFPLYLHAKDIVCHDSGTSFILDASGHEFQINSPLIGTFNVDNLLAAIGSVLALGVELEQVIQAISSTKAIDGRMELFAHSSMPSVVVDYAHTPDALEKALIACRAHCEGKLFVVFGCGGDRDKGKRSEMGRIAEQGADSVLITNDNPRTESPEMIVADILKGLDKPEKAMIVLDRKQAVSAVLKNAQPGDMVLLAGKGHEDYIIIGEDKVDYNERELVSTYYEGEAPLGDKV